MKNSSQHIAAMAMGKSLKEALQSATFGLLEWIQSDFRQRSKSGNWLTH